jgi:RNA methyltransferase, TrmH family
MISSASNASYRRWLMAKERADRKSGELLLEGFHLIQAWSMKYSEPLCLIVADDFRMTTELEQWLAGHTVALEWVSKSLFRKLTDLESFSGPLALVSPSLPPQPIPSANRGDLVFLDRVQDPGNLGTMLRSCAAFGVRQVALSPGTAWPWSAKVLRAGMSAHFNLDIYDEFEASQLFALEGFQLLVTSGLEGQNVQMLDASDLKSASIWCFGNEGSGLSQNLLQAPKARRICIPQHAAVESLNVASALSICLYEQERQRRQ